MQKQEKQKTIAELEKEYDKTRNSYGDTVPYDVQDKLVQLRKELYGRKVAAKKLDGDDPRLMLTISDTGIGMDEDELKEVKERLTDRKDIHNGIGVGNIYRRLHLMYPDSTFDMESVKGSGTITTITIPFIKEAEE